MVNINPADCKPHEVYEGTVRGERWTLQRVGAGLPQSWFGMRPAGSGRSARTMWLDDADVSDLVRLVPARPVTRDDLPDVAGVLDGFVHWNTDPGPVIGHTLDAVVAHLNESGGTPAGEAHKRVLDMAAEVNDLKADRDEAVMRAEMAEQQRDAAHQERLAAMRVKGEQVDRANQAERERDKWQGLAVAHAESITRANLARDDAYTALTDMTNRADKAECERDEWQAKAETPTVTREQREKVADYLWDEMVGSAKSVVRDAVARAFTAAGIETVVEAEQSDPVDELAGRIESATREAVDAVIDMLGHAVERQAVEDSLLATVSDDSRWLAAHVVGQETGQ